MAVLVGLLVALTMSIDVFRLDLSMGPGLSAKNAALYLTLCILAAQYVVRRDGRFEMRALQIVFTLLILYAIFTWGLASTLLKYDHYPVLENALQLKASLADFLIFFAVCFYALRNERDVLIALNFILLACSAANLITLTEAVGITNFGVIDIRDDGRVQGAMGEANQYAAFLCLTIPLYISRVLTTKGLWRFIWVGATMLAMVAMLTTVSRGGFISFAIATAFGCMLFRRKIPVGKLAGYGTLAVVVAVVLLFSLNSNFRSLIIDRLFSESNQASLYGASGGRSEGWAQALGYMVEKPITFITGFGWMAWWTFPFEISPHNTYLNYWFNLGLPGLLGLLFMLGTIVGTAYRTAFSANRLQVEAPMIALVFGTLGLSIAIFFVELYNPWTYTWAIYGVLMRLAMLSNRRDVSEASEPVRESVNPRTADRFGWAAARRT